MTRGLADTSIFIAIEEGRPIDRSRLPQEAAISVVTTGELRSGVLVAPDMASRSARLATLLDALEHDAIPVDEAVAAAWAHLRSALRDTGRRLQVNDSWIAATAIAHDLPLITQDRDFVGVPGLDVVLI